MESRPCIYCEGIATPGTVYRDCNEKDYIAQEWQCGLLDCEENHRSPCGQTFRIHLEGPCLGVDDICESSEGGPVKVRRRIEDYLRKSEPELIFRIARELRVKI